MTGLANFEKVKGDTKMKKKGFTLVELLVVIAIIALLMGILMPALARVRQIAYRMICGTHLKGIGSSMTIYANDNKEDYPIAGLTGSLWSSAGHILKFDPLAPNNDQTFAFDTTGATITSCLFLLVKGYDVTPAMFVCKGDVGTKEFKLSETGTTVREFSLIWDFGMGKGGASPDYPKPGQYNSYAYHSPYNSSINPGTSSQVFPINSLSAPGSPVCSDRNPYLDKNAWGSTASCTGYLNAVGSSTVPPELPATWSGTPAQYTDRDKTGNCAAHQREGQNVLYNDNHANFERYPNCGVQNDHIWKSWSGASRPAEETAQVGGLTSTDNLSASGGDGRGRSRGEMDAYLVSEKNW